MNHSRNVLPAVATFAVIGSFGFLNLDGYQLHLASPWGGIGAMTGEPPTSNWVHGWPVGFAVRPSIYSVSAGRGVKVRSFTGEYGLYSRWPIDESPVGPFSRAAAACDLLLCIVLASGTFVGTRKLAGYFGCRPQFGLRSLFACIFAFAIVIAWRDWIFQSRYVSELLAATAVVFGTCVSTLAIPWRTRKSNVRAQATISAEVI